MPDDRLVASHRWPAVGGPQLLAMIILSAIGWCTLASADSPPSGVTRQVLFESGTDGYHTFRIPSIIQTKEGSLLAFCEGRKNGGGDSGDIDLVMRRSDDQGASWSELVVVWDDAGNTVGNPCPVVDRTTGEIHLLLTWNRGDIVERNIQPGFGDDSRRVFVMKSSDHGRSWTEPREITRDVKREDWSWYATGPGAGIEITHGPHQGRLIIPCDHKRREAEIIEYYSHVIYSDDHGSTWHLGGISPQAAVNECEVVELAGGRLMLNMRNYDRQTRARQVAFSDDGGETWSGQRHDPALIEPICQASIRRGNWPAGEDQDVLLFSNPADREARRRMTVRASIDDGQSWPGSQVLYEGSSAYSCLVSLPSGMAGCLYEVDGYKRILFDRFAVDWVVSAGGGQTAAP